jgi:hypothetical protein
MKLKTENENASCSFKTDEALAIKYPTWTESQELIADN